MITTEKEARRKWCPLVRVRASTVHGASAGYNRTRLTVKQDIKERLLAFFFPWWHNYTTGRYFRCQGSKCMSWRWRDRETGFCGEFGAPDSFDKRSGGAGADDARALPPEVFSKGPADLPRRAGRAGDAWLMIGTALSVGVLVYTVREVLRNLGP